MYVSTLNVSSRGQIVLPKKARQLLGTNTVSLMIDEHDQVLIAPVRELGGSLSAYRQATTADFDEIRTAAWLDQTATRPAKK